MKAIEFLSDKYDMTYTQLKYSNYNFNELIACMEEYHQARVMKGTVEMTGNVKLSAKDFILKRKGRGGSDS